MAVHKRSYRSYEGPLTPRWSRFMILARYSARGIFQSKILTGLFVLSFFFPLVVIAGLYLNHNTKILSLMHIRADQILDVNGTFFMVVMTVQGSFAFLMTAFIGPGMIAPDLANNALPLYFCRPLTRFEYVFGRAWTIVYLLSLITWIPGLLIFGIESNLAGWSWAWEHRNFAAGVMVGSVLWIIVLTLMTLSLSAWVKWKLVAGALLLGINFAASGAAAVVNEVLRTKAGFYLDPPVIVGVIWASFFGIEDASEMSVTGALIGLTVICAVCVWLLSRKIRAFEVVR